MVPLIWSLLNIALFGAFFYTWLKAVRILWHLKSWLAIIFVIGSLGSKGRGPASADFSATGNVQTLKPSTMPVPSPALVSQVIRENFSQTITLSGVYYRDSTGLKLDAGTTSLNGFVLGFKWVPGPVFLSDDDVRKKIRYRTYGDMQWYLLGVNVYTQAGQTLEGDLVIRRPFLSSHATN